MEKLRKSVTDDWPTILRFAGNIRCLCYNYYAFFWCYGSEIEPPLKRIIRMQCVRMHVLLFSKQIESARLEVVWNNTN